MKVEYLVISALLLLLLTSGCVSERTGPDTREAGSAQEDGIEYVGGKYDLKLIPVAGASGDGPYAQKRMVYVKDGKEIDPGTPFQDSMRPGLDWIKTNTPEDAVVMSWWDYGHAIRAYAEREPVIDAPSREILTKTVSMHIGKSPEEIDCPSCSENEVVMEVAGMLLTEDHEACRDMMEKHGAGYLYVHRSDEEKSASLFIALGQDASPIGNTILGKALASGEIEGFELVFSDGTSKIYELFPI